MTKYYIHSIFLAHEGEGIYLGVPQVFVRFQGCAHGCLNCDSKETWSFDTKKLPLNKEQVFDAIDRLCNIYIGNDKNVYNNANASERAIKRLSITGGDPLHPRHRPAVLELINHYRQQGLFINIEAAGSEIVPEIFEAVNFISFDYKTPSTGRTTDYGLIVELAQKYETRFQIKSVIADEDDFYDALMAYLAVQNELQEWKKLAEYELNHIGSARSFGQWQEIIHGEEKTIRGKKDAQEEAGEIGEISIECPINSGSEDQTAGGLNLNLANGILPWVLTPSYPPEIGVNKKFQQKSFLQLFSNILEWNYRAGGPFRVIGQQHKWIFGPDKSDV